MRIRRAPRESGVVGDCIIVAEDERDLRQAIADVFIEAGWSVLEVDSVDDLRIALAEIQPIAVSLDLNLADDSSEGVLRELAGTAIAVILVTASAEATAVAERYGVELVKKPFDVEELIAALARARQRVTAA